MLAELASGFAALQGVHGQTCTFGAASFVGVFGQLRPDDQRMQGAPDRVVSLMVVPSELPLSRPTAGEAISVGGVSYVVIRYDADPSSGLGTYLLSQP